MKYEIHSTTQFRKNLKTMEKRGKNISRLTAVIQILGEGEVLPPKYRDHALTGNHIGFRECHVEPDWLLVYCVNKTTNTLHLSTTGSHSDLDF